MDRASLDAHTHANETAAPVVSGALREWLLSVAGISEQRVGRLLEILSEEEADSTADLHVLASRVGGAFDVRKIQPSWRGRSGSRGGDDRSSRRRALGRDQSCWISTSRGP